MRVRRAGVVGAVAAGLLLSGCTSSGGSSPRADGADGSTSSVPSTAPPARPPGTEPAGAATATCHDVEQAFTTANVAFTGIEDDTAGTQKAARNGTLPYAITLHCNVRLPGSRHPQHVQLDRAPGNSAKLVTALATIGHSTRLPTAAGYGDVGYVIPQGDGTYALLAGKGGWILDIGDLRDAGGIKDVAHYLLGRL